MGDRRPAQERTRMKFPYALNDFGTLIQEGRSTWNGSRKFEQRYFPILSKASRI